MTEKRPAIVLLVEDDPVISLDTSMILQQLGAEEVAMAASLEEADAAIERQLPVLAVMDIDLHGSTSLALAQRLRELGVPCVFTTGHSAGMPLPETLRDVPIVHKPYDLAELKEALAPYLPGSRDPTPG